MTLSPFFTYDVRDRVVKTMIGEQALGREKTKQNLQLLIGTTYKNTFCCPLTLSQIRSNYQLQYYSIRVFEYYSIMFLVEKEELCSSKARADASTAWKQGGCNVFNV